MPAWRKLGRLYTPVPKGPKLQSHAANPVAIPLHGDVFRIFYSGRDSANRSSVGAVDIDILRRTVVRDHPLPACSHGGPDTCHSHGISIGCHYRTGGRHWMLFMGWQIPEDAHWRGDIGRLEIAADLNLQPAETTAFMARDTTDPVSLSYPWVLHRQGLWHMWYGSTVTWDAGNGEMLHVLRHATSADGMAWTRHGQAVPHALGVAQAFSRPTVAETADGGLAMWFSYRSGTGQSYRIGHASSKDGFTWDLALEEAGIDVSDSGWDSQMLCYPFVFDHRGQRFMLYNGNGYGQSGFGLAVLDG